MLTAEQRRLRGVIARRNAKSREPVTTQVDDATLAAAQEMRAGNLAGHIRDVVDGWPPLTETQRDQLALLLRPSSEPVNGAGT